MLKSDELRQQRSALLADAKAILNQAKAENRNELTDDEQDKYNRFEKDIDGLKLEIENCQRNEKIESVEAEMRSVQPRKVTQSPITSRSNKTLSLKEQKDVFNAWGAYGSKGYRHNANMVQRAEELGIDYFGKDFECRTSFLESGTASNLLHQEYISEFENKLRYFSPILNYFKKVETPTGNDLPISQMDYTSASATIVGEGGDFTAGPIPTASKVTMKGWLYSTKHVTISSQALQDSSIDLVSYLGDAFGTIFGATFDAAVVSTNAGTAAPEGLLHGVSAGVNLITGNPLTYQKLLDLETSLSIAYRVRPGVAMVMHDATWQGCRGLVDDNHRPIMSVDVQDSAQKRLLGYPVVISNNMTSIGSPGDNQPLILFADLQSYRWRTVVGSEIITRLNELYAGTGLVGYVKNMRVDGRWTNFPALCATTLNSYDS